MIPAASLSLRYSNLKIMSAVIGWELFPESITVSRRMRAMVMQVRVGIGSPLPLYVVIHQDEGTRTRKFTPDEVNRTGYLLSSSCRPADNEDELPQTIFVCHYRSSSTPSSFLSPHPDKGNTPIEATTSQSETQIEAIAALKRGGQLCYTVQKNTFLGGRGLPLPVKPSLRSGDPADRTGCRHRKWRDAVPSASGLWVLSSAIPGPPAK